MLFVTFLKNYLFVKTVKNVSVKVSEMSLVNRQLVGEDASKILSDTPDRFQNGEGALAQEKGE
jgi:hypothetical protein